MIPSSCDYWQALTNITNIEIDYPTKVDAAGRESRQHRREIHSAVILERTAGLNDGIDTKRLVNDLQVWHIYICRISIDGKT